MFKSKKILILIAIIIFILLQFIPVIKKNPPSESEIQVSPAVKEVLKKSCYDCHSNYTRYPAYSYIFPASAIIAHHINEAREELNFSEWESYSDTRKESKAEEIIDELKSSGMPLSGYVLFHPEARLDDKQKEILIEWAKSIQKNKEE